MSLLYVSNMVSGNQNKSLFLNLQGLSCLRLEGSHLYLSYIPHANVTSLIRQLRDNKWSRSTIRYMATFQPTNYQTRSKPQATQPLTTQPQSPAGSSLRRGTDTEQAVKESRVPTLVPLEEPSTSRSSPPERQSTSGSAPPPAQDDTYTMSQLTNLVPKFNGTGNGRQWWKKMDCWRRHQKMSDANFLILLPLYLDGVASTWLDSLQPAPTTTTDFQTAFTRRFIEETTTQTGFLTERQAPSESGATYIERLQEKTTGMNIPELFLVQVIVNGLQQQLKAIVLPQGPQTLDTLSRQVILAERAVEATQSPRIASVTEESQPMATIAALLTQQQQQLDKLSTQLQKVRFDRPKPSDSHRSPQDNGQAWRNTRTPHQQGTPNNYCYRCGGNCRRQSCPALGRTCSYCQRLNHFSTVCFKRLGAQ